MTFDGLFSQQQQLIPLYDFTASPQVKKNRFFYVPYPESKINSADIELDGWVGGKEAVKETCGEENRCCLIMGVKKYKESWRNLVFVSCVDPDPKIKGFVHKFQRESDAPDPPLPRLAVSFLSLPACLIFCFPSSQGSVPRHQEITSTVVRGN